MKAALDAGASERDIADEHFGTWCRNYRAFERYRRITNPGRSEQTKVVVFFGPSGSGKSHRAEAMAGSSAYWAVRSPSAPNGVWWDGYEGQDVVILDEFYGWIKRDFLYRLCDRYPLHVETKGGAVQFIPKTIIFTSNSPPDEWYKNVGLGAMIRRLQPPVGEIFYVNSRLFPTKEEYCRHYGYACDLQVQTLLGQDFNNEAREEEEIRAVPGVAAPPSFSE